MDYLLRNAAQRGFHPTGNPSSGWFMVPPAVAASPAVPFSTRVSAGMKPPLGRDSLLHFRVKRFINEYTPFCAVRPGGLPHFTRCVGAFNTIYIRFSRMM